MGFWRRVFGGKSGRATDLHYPELFEGEEVKAPGRCKALVRELWDECLVLWVPKTPFAILYQQLGAQLHDANHPHHRLAELLPNRWKPTPCWAARGPSARITWLLLREQNSISGPSLLSCRIVAGPQHGCSRSVGCSAIAARCGVGWHRLATVGKGRV